MPETLRIDYDRNLLASLRSQLMMLQNRNMRAGSDPIRHDEIMIAVSRTQLEAMLKLSIEALTARAIAAEG